MKLYYITLYDIMLYYTTNGETNWNSTQAQGSPGERRRIAVVR